jgi:hypothetical protein
MRRNEVATSNEIRKWVGLKVSNDPRADLLANPNMPGSQAAQSAPATSDIDTETYKEAYDQLYGDKSTEANGE